MEKQMKNRRIITSTAIQQINDATIVLRHFVELSAKLLPFFNELSKQKKLSPLDNADRNKIIEVFNNYSFDNQTSEILMKSDILEVIQTTFRSIEKRVPGQKSEAELHLNHFRKKHRELVLDWNSTDNN